MSETTPYDGDRADYSREALARLVVSDQAARVADFAAGLVSTRHDAYTGIGGRASQAAQVVELAAELLSAAVIYEYERGGSWSDLAGYLGVTPEQVEERYGPDLLRWRAAFDVPLRYDESRRRWMTNLPPAAHDPKRAGELLDRWARRHLTLVDNPDEVTGTLRGTGIREAPQYPESD